MGLAGGRGHGAWALGARAAWRGARREPREAAARRAEKSPLASQCPRHSLLLHPYPTRRGGLVFSVPGHKGRARCL